MNSSTTVEERIAGGRQPASRRPPLSGVTWKICILISANDAYMRELARSLSDKREAEVGARWDVGTFDGGRHG